MPRKHKELSVDVKLKILHDVDKKEQSKTDIAKKYDIPKTTLSTIIKYREKIEKLAAEGGKLRDRKRVRTAKYENIETQLFEWFCINRAANIPLSGPLLQKKADELALRAGIDGFKCSSGWLSRFKERHGIVSLNICGEAASVSEEAVQTWLDNNKHTIEQYKPCDIFNMDETGLFYNLLPDRTLAVKGEKCHGGKKSKERITVLLCCNADGSEKFRPLVLGKFAKPRCMKGVSHLPCDYDSNKNAWVTATIFRQWMLKMERRMAVKNRKVLLLMDRCAAHSMEGLDLKNVRVLFLPANTTSRLQPLDQGIIFHVKRSYRRRIVQSLLLKIGQNQPIQNFKWSVLDAMRNVTKAWNEVTPEVIQKCFQKAGFRNNDDEPEVEDIQMETDEEDDDDWSDVKSNLKCTTEFVEYIHVDDDIVTSVLTPDEGEPVAGTSKQSLDEDIECLDEPEQDSNSDHDEPIEIPSKNELYSALGVFDRYVTSGESTEEFQCAFEIISKEIRVKCRPVTKQTKMDDFFKRV